MTPHGRIYGQVLTPEGRPLFNSVTLRPLAEINVGKVSGTRSVQAHGATPCLLLALRVRAAIVVDDGGDGVA